MARIQLLTALAASLTLVSATDVLIRLHETCALIDGIEACGDVKFHNSVIVPAGTVLIDTNFTGSVTTPAEVPGCSKNFLVSEKSSPLELRPDGRLYNKFDEPEFNQFCDVEGTQLSINPYHSLHGNHTG